MTKYRSLTQERLVQLLKYDPETGTFTRISSYYKSRIGKEVGTRDTRGYIVINLDHMVYPAHRLAWLYVYGYWPEFHIDHINGDTEDNRLANLREATAKQNQENRTKIQKNNKTGYRGVIRNEKSGRYLAYIKHHREQHYLGSFATAEDASAAYRVAQDELYTHHGTEYSG